MTNDEFFEWADDEGGLNALVIGHDIDVSDIEDESLRGLVQEYRDKYMEIIFPLYRKIYCYENPPL